MLYKVTREAENDLTEIYVYGFQNFGEAQAGKYFSELEVCFQLLGKNIFAEHENFISIPTFQWEIDVSPLLRRGLGGLFLSGVAPDDLILIVRILHASMDVQRHLSAT